MRCYKVICRFVASSDFEKHFSSSSEALDYFDFLVRFVLDNLISQVWFISVSKGSKVLKSFNNFLICS